MPSCTCSKPGANVRIVPLSTVNCAFECTGCNAVELNSFQSNANLTAFADQVKQFEFLPGWSDGKFLVCFGKVQTESGFESCLNENPEAFRYVPRSSCEYYHCNDCDACLPITPFEADGGVGKSNECPLCGKPMTLVQDAPGNDTEFPCRACFRCLGALPLKRVRQYELARQADSNKQLGNCECGGDLIAGRGVRYHKCTCCDATLHVRAMRSGSFSGEESEEAIKCDQCHQDAAYPTEDAYGKYLQCRKCSQVRLDAPQPAGPHNATDDQLLCEHCRGSRFEVRLSQSAELEMHCAACQQVRKLPQGKPQPNLEVHGVPATLPEHREVPLLSLTQVAVGEHIAIARVLGTYKHHMIVERLEPEHNAVHVIEYSGGPEKAAEGNTPPSNKTKWQAGTVQRNRYTFDAQKDALFRYEYALCDDATVVLQRAESRLQEQKYNLLTNNCEHFAVWCKTGVAQSGQVSQFRRSFVHNVKHYMYGWMQGQRPAVKPGLVRSASASASLGGFSGNDVCNLIDALAIRLCGNGLVVRELLQWSRTVLTMVQQVRNRQMDWLDALKLVVLDLARRFALVLANLGSFEVSCQVARILLGYGVKASIAPIVGTAAAAVTFAAAVSVGKQLGQLAFEEPQLCYKKLQK